MLALERITATESELTAFGAELAIHCLPGAVIYLRGDLGAGKTTLVRGALRGLGYTDVVRSPTYTLVEVYEIGEHSLCHFDLYRMGDPDELAYIGVRDYFGTDAVCWIEWPEQGSGYLPPADIEIQIDDFLDGRVVKLTAHSELGSKIIGELP